MITLAVLATANQATINADDSPSANTVPIRKADGSLVATTHQAAKLQSTGALQCAITPAVKITSYTSDLTATDWFNDATTGAITVTMPAAAGNQGIIQRYWLNDNSGHGITLAGVVGKSTTTTQNDCITAVSDGINWRGK